MFDGVLSIGVAIETERGTYMIVDNDVECEYYYSLINLENGRLIGMANSMNSFRSRMGEVY